MHAPTQDNVVMTWLLRSERMGKPTTDWVGRAGLADMGEERLPCALDP